MEWPCLRILHMQHSILNERLGIRVITQSLSAREERGYSIDKLVMRSPRAVREALQKIGLKASVEEYNLPPFKRDWWASK